MDFRGLTSQEVLDSRKKYGDNVIEESQPVTFWDAFKDTFNDTMIRVLLAIAAIMIVMFFLGYAEIFEPLGTIVAVLLVAFFSAKTSVSSDTKYRELKDRQEKETCKVYRDGKLIVIPVDEIVVGDCVLLQSGDKVPADGLLRTGNLSVDNSSMNGEAEECHKVAADEACHLSEKMSGDVFVDSSSLFRGVVVTDGEGIMVVERVGKNTIMGKMAEEMSEDEIKSPLTVKLDKLASQISKFGYIGAIVIGIVYMVSFVLQAGGPAQYLDIGFAGIFKDFIEALSLAIIIIVCAVPEGLPLMISLVLMQNTSKMYDHNVLVRKAIGIETAGSLNILFSDKTGTITKGHLEVVHFFLGNGGVVSRGKMDSYSELSDKLFTSIGMNTQSLFDSNHQIVGGNKTDQACMSFLGEESYNSIHEKYREVPIEVQNFNSTNKFSQVYLAGVGTFYKGAPERLLKKATKYIDREGSVHDIDRKVIDSAIDGLARKAMRVLAFGYSNSPMIHDKINDDLVIIGFVGIRDDVRPEARDAIAQVKGAGIQVVMITGDKMETAVAIAKDAGLLMNEDDVAVSSAELNGMSDDEVKSLIPRIRVIARALPTDKSRMVRLCQEMNLVVGMTGDGVNDSPALKRADVGFAMGSGTEAAKEAGKIVILDDNFQSIKDAIWYGRTIYHNILKFCMFQLTINVAAVLVSALSVFFGINEPLKVTHLLFVNLVMDGLGAMMLGNEPALEKYMTESPRRRDESLVSKSMAIRIGVSGGWLTILSFLFLKLPFFSQFFETDEQHLTAYFVLFIWAALFNGFNVRDDKYGIFKGLDENKGFMKVFAIIVAVQAVIVNAALVPLSAFSFVGSMFSCTPFNPMGWLVVVLLALTMIPVDLVRKAVIS